jgi:hypothetical protein
MRQFVARSSHIRGGKPEGLDSRIGRHELARSRVKRQLAGDSDGVI